MVGGFVVLAAAGTAAAIKLTKSDADRIEQSTGVPVDEMSEDDLVAVMQDLGIQSIELDENDQAILTEQEAEAPLPQTAPPAAVPAQPSYLQELEQLGTLRDQGVITDEEFEAKKKQLLGL